MYQTRKELRVIKQLFLIIYKSTSFTLFHYYRINYFQNIHAKIKNILVFKISAINKVNYKL